MAQQNITKSNAFEIIGRILYGIVVFIYGTSSRGNKSCTAAVTAAVVVRQQTRKVFWKAGLQVLLFCAIWVSFAVYNFKTETKGVYNMTLFWRPTAICVGLNSVISIILGCRIRKLKDPYGMRWELLADSLVNLILGPLAEIFGHFQHIDLIKVRATMMIALINGILMQLSTYVIPLLAKKFFEFRTTKLKVHITDLELVINTPPRWEQLKNRLLKDFCIEYAYFLEAYDAALLNEDSDAAAAEIIEQFIQVGSRFELNLSGKLRSDILFGKKMHDKVSIQDLFKVRIVVVNAILENSYLRLCEDFRNLQNF